MKKELYEYTISGYYYSNEERVHFHRENVQAEDEIEAMKKIVGQIAWDESLDGNTFRLDVIHYD